MDEHIGRISAWLHRCFGAEIATNRRERAARLLEEAVELAQVEDVGREMIEAIVNRVYSRPVGTPESEVAGVAVTLCAYAGAAGISIDAEIQREIERVESYPPQYFRDRHNAKASAGTALKVSTLPPIVRWDCRCCGVRNTVVVCPHDPTSVLVALDTVRADHNRTSPNCVFDEHKVSITYMKV